MTKLKTIVDSLADQAVSAIELTSHIGHPGEGGRAREQVIIRFLSQVLPADFAIDTGFVIDALGQISRQVDVVIYRRGFYPVLDIGGVKHFMAESVAAAFEIKAVIGSARVLHDALNNIESVKRLDRSAEGHNAVIFPERRPVNTSAIQDQVLGGVIACASMGLNKTTWTINDWLNAHEDRRVWPNCYFDVRSFFIEHVIVAEGFREPPVPHHTVDANRSKGISPFRPIGGRSLAVLALDLLNFLRVSSVIDYGWTGFARSGTRTIGYFPQFSVGSASRLGRSPRPGARLLFISMCSGR